MRLPVCVRGSGSLGTRSRIVPKGRLCYISDQKSAVGRQFRASCETAYVTRHMPFPAATRWNPIPHIAYR